MSELTKLPYPIPFPESLPPGSDPVPFFPIPPLTPYTGPLPPRRDAFGSDTRIDPPPSSPSTGPKRGHSHCNDGEYLATGRRRVGTKNGKPLYETYSFCVTGKGGTG